MANPCLHIQYRAQFSHGQLKHEQRGLDALTRCLAGEPGAPARARRYLQGGQTSVLAERLETACKGVLEP